jgi:hypothetical protein
VRRGLRWRDGLDGLAMTGVLACAPGHRASWPRHAAKRWGCIDLDQRLPAASICTGCHLYGGACRRRPFPDMACASKSLPAPISSGLLSHGWTIQIVGPAAGLLPDWLTGAERLAALLACLCWRKDPSVLMGDGHREGVHHLQSPIGILRDPIDPIRALMPVASGIVVSMINGEREAWPRAQCGLAAYNFGSIASTCTAASLTPLAGWRTETSGHTFVTIIFARQPAAGKGDERIALGIGSCRNWNSRSS